MKNVVVCCDGTANEFATDRTNVVKLYYALENGSNAQVAFYHPGLGTMEPPGALTDIGRRATRLLGKAIGYGLEADIRDAYVFVLENFEPGDRLFLLGFSRGAYTARAVASLLKMYGLLPRGNAPLAPYAIRLLKGIPHGADEAHSSFRLADEFRATFSPSHCAPHFVGVWDTVSSIGWISNPLHLPYTANNPDIAHGRHAVSIDERRAFFRTNLFVPHDPPRPSGPRDLKQVWFAGVHADVGGYPESQSGLAKLALEWMLEEAQACGLLVNKARADRVLGRGGGDYVAPNPMAPTHESLTLNWLAAEIIPKQVYSNGVTRYRANFGARRQMPEGALVHWSVYERGEDYLRRIPASAIKVERSPCPAPAPTPPAPS